MAYLYGSDFSSFQKPEPDMAEWSFAYVKATEGTSYINPNLYRQSAHVEKTVKNRGYYHFLRPGDVKKQAQFFVNTIGIKECKDPYVELWLDFEADGLTGNEPKVFIDEVKRLTGKQAGMYISQSWLVDKSRFDWSDLPADLPLWVAYYTYERFSGSGNKAGNNLSQTELNNFYKIAEGIPHFKQVDVWQYSDAQGYDWNIRFTPFPSQSKPKPSQPKYKVGQVVKLKDWVRPYDKNGKLFYPDTKKDSVKLTKGTYVTLKKNVKDTLWEVDYYGMSFKGQPVHLWSGNFE